MTFEEFKNIITEKFPEVTPEQMDRVLSTARSSFDFSGVRELTVEAGRPDAITESNLKILKKHNVTRICVNPQTFSNDTLIRLGRNHTAEDVIEKYQLAKDMFSINMDLIAGLEGETVETFALGVENAVKTGADNITVHCLSLKSGAKLKEDVLNRTNFILDKVSFVEKRSPETVKQYKDRLYDKINDRIGHFLSSAPKEELELYKKL